ncbi:respiratory nitrate reductase subunit gamma [Tatumella saanichensis]|uniref:respiratory nitrate reductase subunit gamma n=1 Tax=Tatumella saanichensis TaxID=480813 RepID=UPI0004A2E8B4|nr:respiratory nitrate reductase subunit gamma [Tatumella saanichensis]
MSDWLNGFLFNLYPYLCGTVFLVGSVLRYDYGQYSWRAASSQMLDKKGLTLVSNLFHIGILGIFFGHLVGLLTPHWLYEPLMSAATKQMLAMSVGGLFGLLTVIGGLLLLKRRLFRPRVRATSTPADILILALLLIQGILGLSTLFFSAQHLDGTEMMKLASWAQRIVTFRGNAAQSLDGVALIFRVHLVLGMTLFLLFPFTRLVHIWSVPLEYLTRRYQLVRSRR